MIDSNWICRMTTELPSGRSARIWVAEHACVIDVDGFMTIVPDSRWRPIRVGLAPVLATMLAEAGG